MSEHQEMQKKFSGHTWKGEHPCGNGSVFKNTEVTRNFLSTIVEKYSIHSISDAGAGNLSWIHSTKWPHDVSYQGYDIDPKHEDVIEFDITTQILPERDLILCRHVLNHLFRWPKLERAAMDNFTASGSKYVLCSHDPNHNDYVSVWGEPLETIIEAPLKLGGRSWHYSLWRLNND